MSGIEPGSATWKANVLQVQHYLSTTLEVFYVYSTSENQVPWNQLNQRGEGPVQGKLQNTTSNIKGDT